MNNYCILVLVIGTYFVIHLWQLTIFLHWLGITWRECQYLDKSGCWLTHNPGCTQCQYDVAQVTRTVAIQSSYHNEISWHILSLHTEVVEVSLSKTPWCATPLVFWIHPWCLSHTNNKHPARFLSLCTDIHSLPSLIVSWVLGIFLSFWTLYGISWFPTTRRRVTWSHDSGTRTNNSLQSSVKQGCSNQSSGTSSIFGHCGGFRLAILSS